MTCTGGCAPPWEGHRQVWQSHLAFMFWPYLNVLGDFISMSVSIRHHEDYNLFDKLSSGKGCKYITEIHTVTQALWRDRWDVLHGFWKSLSSRNIHVGIRHLEWGFGECFQPPHWIYNRRTPATLSVLGIWNMDADCILSLSKYTLLRNAPCCLQYRAFLWGFHVHDKYSCKLRSLSSNDVRAYK